MRARILSNTIPLPDEQQAVEQAVLDAIGERPESELWTVRIDEPADRPDYIIDIRGPNFKWRRGFFGPVEQTPDFIHDEVRKALSLTRKATLIPLFYVDHDVLSRTPFPIWGDIAIENVEGLLTAEHFSLWREYIDQRSRKRLASAPVAMVHRYSSDDLVGRREEESKDLLFKVVTCLRLIKPTRDEFTAVQAKVGEGGQMDVFSVTPPSHVGLNVPSSEALNQTDVTDLRALNQCAAAFLEMADAGPAGFRRAIRFLNLGYQGMQDSVIQLITWVIGIESIYRVSDEGMSQDELFSRIVTLLQAESDIYSDSAMRRYFGDFRLTVGDVLPDLFDLRNRLAHGLWVPDEWKDRSGHSTPGGSIVQYADTLREAASYILRKSILQTVLNFLPTRKSLG